VLGVSWMLDVGCWMLDVGCWMLDKLGRGVRAYLSEGDRFSDWNVRISRKRTSFSEGDKFFWGMGQGTRGKIRVGAHGECGGA
jgi:hypothetical protein